MSNRAMCAVAVLVGCGGVSQIDDSGDSEFGGSPQADVVIVATTVYVSVPLLSGGSATVTAGGAIEVVDATGGVTSTTTTRAVAGGSHVASSSSIGGSASGGSSSKSAGGSSMTPTKAAGGSSSGSASTTVACRDSYRSSGSCTLLTTTCGNRQTFSIVDNDGSEIVRFSVESEFRSYVDTHCEVTGIGGSGSGGSGAGGLPQSGGTSATTATSTATECRGFVDGITAGDKLCFEYLSQGSCVTSESPVMPNRSLCGYRATLVCANRSERHIACYRACVACVDGASDECTTMLNQPILTSDPCEWQP